MSKNNGKKRKDNRHTNKLVPSDKDGILLCAAVQTRFLDLCESYRRIRGVDLIPPPELDSDMYLWRQMTVRHKSGDYRNTLDELNAVKRVAQWTVDVNSLLRGQEPVALEWKE